MIRHPFELSKLATTSLTPFNVYLVLIICLFSSTSHSRALRLLSISLCSYLTASLACSQELRAAWADPAASPAGESNQTAVAIVAAAESAAMEKICNLFVKKVRQPARELVRMTRYSCALSIDHRIKYIDSCILLVSQAHEKPKFNQRLLNAMFHAVFYPFFVSSSRTSL